MNIYNTKLAWSILLVIVLLTSCTPASRVKQEPSASSEPIQTEEIADIVPDTIRIISEEIDYFLNYELDEQIFQVMMAKGVEHTKKEIENLYVEENDFLYEFTSQLGKYTFVDVTNSGRKFLVSAQANWAKEDTKDLSGMQSRLVALLHKLNKDEASEAVVKISNIEDFTELYVSYKDGKPVAYELNKWLD